MKLKIVFIIHSECRISSF